MQAGVPNSVPHDWKAGVGTNGSLFASEANLKKELESKGITPYKEIINMLLPFRHEGVVQVYMQFTKAGYEKVRLYDGSIIDWAH